MTKKQLKIGTKVKKKIDGSIVITDRLTKEKATYKPLKGDSKRFINRKALNGTNRSNYLVENWAYKVIEQIGTGSNCVPEGVYFIWNGIRNRYEWTNKDGRVLGLTKEQIETNTSFKKVRIPKKLKLKVEWSPAPPTSKELQEMGKYASKAFAVAQRSIAVEKEKYDRFDKTQPLSVLPKNHSQTQLRQPRLKQVRQKSRVQAHREVRSSQVSQSKKS